MLMTKFDIWETNFNNVGDENGQNSYSNLKVVTNIFGIGVV